MLITIQQRLLASFLVACIFCTVSWAQPIPDGSTDGAAIEAEEPIAFNFSGATYTEVIDYFSRVTGLPVIREAGDPEGTLNFLSPERYDAPEALRVLNIILQARGVMLRVDDDMLYLQQLTEMQRENIPTYIGQLDDQVTDDQIITIVIPLHNALATTVAEQMKEMVASYGSITPMQRQNSLIITETAGQVHRLQSIISELDKEDVEGVIRIFPVRNAKANDLFSAIKSLLSKRVEKFVINQQGKQVRIEEESMPGLSISVDVRTNSLIAKGAQMRIDELERTLKLLDVPDTVGARTLRTYALRTVTPADINKHLGTLFSTLKKEDRPTILPLPMQNKITLIGSEGHINEAEQLIRELDGPAMIEDVDPAGAHSTVTEIIVMEHVDVRAMTQAITGLLNPRQKAQVKLVAAPDGESLIVSGHASDVQSVRTFMELFDQPTQIDRQVRLMRVSAAAPQDVVDKAAALYDQQVDREDPVWDINATFNGTERVLTLVGTAQSIARFTESMRMVESVAVVERETRQLSLTHATPSRMIASLQSMSRQLLQPRDGTTYNEPVFTAIDAMDTMLVDATSEQLGVIESLIQTLDRPDPNAYQFRVLQLPGADVDSLLAKTRYVYEQLTLHRDATEVPSPNAEFDPVTGNLLVSGRSESVRLFEQALGQARQLLPPDRTGVLIELSQAQATTIIEPLQELLATATSTDGARAIPDPEISVVGATNSIYVVAEPAQHQVIRRFITQLDTFEMTELPPMRLLQVRAADAAQLSSMLMRRYQSRPAEQRREQPVELDADAATNTLIITAHAEVFDEIKEFVDTVNSAGDTRPDRETMMFPLQRARAEDLARALERLYPEPPMPLDRRGRPMPHLREPKEVQVSSDSGTNTLIVEAPAARRAQFDVLVEQLDRVELPPQASLKTYRIERGDVAQIARTLTDLSRTGVLSEIPPDGGKSVDVTIQAEPVTGTLIVAGDSVTFEKVEQMLTDLQAVPIQRSLRVFDVMGVNPTDLAAQAMRLFKEQHEGEAGFSDPTVEVDADNSTLLIVAEDESMIRFASILNELQDSIAAPPDVRLIPLEHATATEVVSFLEQLSTSELVMMQGRGKPAPAFEAIDRTNSVLVAAQSEQHVVIQSLVQELDRVEQLDMPPLRILQLRTADASTIAQALSRQYDGRPTEQRSLKPVSITADVQTNTLMVAAHPEMLPEIQSIVDDLNENDRRDYEGREIRIFPLKVARAEELARTIDTMYPEPPMPRDSRGRPRPDLQKPREVVVRADVQTNALIVDAPAQRMPGFEKLVEQLDRQKIIDETKIMTYQVVHADLDSLAETIRSLANSGTLSPTAQDRRIAVSVTTEPVTRTLVISGPVDAFDRIDQIIEELDVRRSGPATSLRFFRLEHARAETMADMLRDVLERRLLEDVPDAGTDSESLLNVTADRKTNTLIISAPEAIMPVAENLIEQLDDATAAVGDPIIRVRPLTFADADTVAQSLNQALPQMVSKATGDPVDVRLISAPGSNALILVGLEKDLSEVESLIEPLDARPAMDAIDAKTFALAHADAQTIAPILENLLTDQMDTDPRLVLERIRRSRGEIDLTPKIRVEADQRTNSLIVSGPQRTVSLAESLIAQLDGADDRGNRGYNTYTPLLGDPVRLAQTVTRVMQSMRPDGRPSSVELIAESESGAIVVIGPQHEIDDAMTLLARWDEQTRTPPQVDLGIVHLVNSDAAVVAPTIATLLNDRTRWPESIRALERAGIGIAQPTVTPDAPNNRLLISAPAELMAVARRLVEQLDAPAENGAVADVRVFALTRADAAAVATAVSSAMQARAASRPGLPTVRINAEPTSNTLVVAATPEQMTEIEGIINTLDETPGRSDVQVRTVFLKNARSERIVPVLQSLLGEEESIDPDALPVWARFDFMQEQKRLRGNSVPFRIAADERLNAIVLTGPVEILDVGEQLVGQLDVGSDDQIGGRNLRVLTIANADAGELATTLGELFDEESSDGPPPVIRVNTSSNSLLVRATLAQHETIAGIVEDIDDATLAGTKQFRLIPLDPSRADAASIARTLEQLLDRGTDGSASVEVITVDELRRRRQKGAEPSESSEEKPLASTIANFAMWTAAPGMTAIADIVVNENKQDIEAAPSAMTDDDQDIVIAVDEATNSLVVIGSERAIERIESLAQQLQNQLPEAPGRIRYIPLPEQANARELGQLLNQTIRQLVPPGGKRGDISRRASVISDDAANGIVVAANDYDFMIIGDLIAALSSPAAAADQMLVKNYPLNTITADRAAKSIQDLIGAGPTPRRGSRQAERMRQIALTLLDGDDAYDAVFDPTRMRITIDTVANALTVMAPPEAIEFLDRYVEMIDQSPINAQTTLKLYPMKYAKADNIGDVLEGILRNRFQSMRQTPGATQIRPEFAADMRTNTLLVTAAPEQLAEVDELLQLLDTPLASDAFPLRVIELNEAQPSRAAQLLKRIVLRDRQELISQTLIEADDNTGLLLVRASDEINVEIDSVLAEIDREATDAFEVRTIVLERANPASVATALQRLYDDRARIAGQARGRRDRGRRVSIIGDPQSRTLLVAAAEDDFNEISELVTQFDSVEASKSLEYRVFDLTHARADQIVETLQGLINDLTWNQGSNFFRFDPWSGFGSSQQSQGTLAIRAEPRMNAIIVSGEGDKFSLVEELIGVLDTPTDEADRRIVRLYPFTAGSMNLMEDLLEEVFDQSRNDWYWDDSTTDELKPVIRIDDKTRSIVVSATPRDQEEVAAMISMLSEQYDDASQEVDVFTVQYAEADEIADALQTFMEERAELTNRADPTATIVPSASANALVVSADMDDMAMIQDLLSRLDQEDPSGERRTEIILVEDGEVNEIARILKDQFDDRRSGLSVTPDARTSSLVVSAPRDRFEQIRALIAQLDTPTHRDTSVIRTYALTGANAEDVVDILSDTLQLDARGETEGVTIQFNGGDPIEVSARIVADRRSNSLIVTSTEESLPIIESLIQNLDDVPAVNPVDYRLIPLEHALAIDVRYTLQQFTRNFDDGQPQPRIDYDRLQNQLIIAATVDQFAQIERIIKQLDVPSAAQRVTDFVPLEYARAEQVQEALSVFYGSLAIEADTPEKLNATIVADPATNSLVISAAESEWTNIRNLLEKLDSPDYDSSLQLAVIPLTYADSTSVARAINEAFQGVVDQQRNQNDERQPQRGDNGERRDMQAPTVLVDSEEWVRAAAEPVTNSVIVSASRQNQRKVGDIIKQLDVAEYTKLPPPQLIVVTEGDPVALAESINTIYERGSQQRGGKTLRIVGDATSNTIIVRAEEEEFQQIRALANALQQETERKGLQVQVLTLKDAPASRVAQAIRSAYQAKAQLANQALSIEVDAPGNSLVVAASGSLLEEIAATVSQLDQLSPAASQGIFIIDLEHVDSAEAVRVIDSIGLNRPQAADSVARLVVEPIKVSTLNGRNALIVIANPADRDTVVSLLKSLDAEPELAQNQMRIVRLKNAEAGAMVSLLENIFDPSQQAAQTPLAQAVQEQVRRLSVRRNGAETQDLHLDLTIPIRLIADETTNAVLVASTEPNVLAIVELVESFDNLPITEAVTVQLFPLENITAENFVRIVEDLFQQGKDLAGVPGTQLQGVPGGIVGRALLDAIALSVDERTNTVIAAGKEDAVAFVEVMADRLDTGIAVGWVEPRVMPLEYADAVSLAETLEAILVEGQTDLPDAAPLQRQIGRLRMASGGGNVVQSESFQPMHRLLIRPDAQLNALILVGTPANLETVEELVSMLDIEAASPSASVRIYPVEHASASRLRETIARMFDQQISAGTLRNEDRVVIEADERTNSLVVTTSTRSFDVFEHLLDLLDADVAPDLRSIRRIELKFASAARLGDLIQEMMDARLERLRRTQPETAELERATIIAEPRTNSLVIAASNESYEVIRRMAEELDNTTLDDDSLVEVFTLTRGNVERIEQMVNQIMQRRYAELPSEIRVGQMPLIMTDPRTNSVLVAANREDLKAIEGLIAKIESAPDNPAIGLHVIALERPADAETLAPRLQSLMRDRQQSLGDASTSSDRVTIEPDMASNSLIVAANEENLEAVRSLIDLLARAEPEMEFPLEIVALRSSQAQDMVELLNELYVNGANERLGREVIRLSADERLNAVVISAPPDAGTRVRAYIAQMDGEQPTRVNEIKYIPLKSANALETVSLIENVLSGRGIGQRRSSDQATVIKYLREMSDDDPGLPIEDGIEVSTAIRESISLTPDIRTNTVIVSAPRESIQLIEQMIRDLDDSSQGTKSIRIFHLVNADAQAMSEIITNLFNLRQGRDLFVLKPPDDTGGMEGGLSSGGGAGMLGGTELTAVPDERQQLSITVDARTNSLLVSGSPTYLELVAEVVEELDAADGNEREFFSYPLLNGDAEEIAQVIDDFIQQEQRKLVETLGNDQVGSAARLLEREVTIRGDSKSNTLLVSASPRYASRVRDMISELDIDPPQVLIQVMLAEVTLDTTDEWGVDLDFAANAGSSAITGGYGLASSAFVGGLGVPNLAVASEDFNLLIRAMQSQGRLQVLSNPSVMAANNSEARIQIGEVIQVPSSTSVSDSGQVNSTIQELDLGVILLVEPSINPDGFVRMDISPSISSLSERTTQISEGFQTPVIIKREADTTVTVRDGQTIVIGGLISDRYERVERKVPFFGDLPVFGPMFRNHKEVSAKTELLIVLTPYVIESPASTEINDTTAIEVDRLSVPEEVKESIRTNLRRGKAGLLDADGKPIPVHLQDDDGPLTYPMREETEKSKNESDPTP